MCKAAVNYAANWPDAYEQVERFANLNADQTSAGHDSSHR
jgi:hypothetical protein